MSQRRSLNEGRIQPDDDTSDWTPMHSYTEDSRPTAAELAELPTLSTAQTSDLKYELMVNLGDCPHEGTGADWPSRYDGVRFWVARTGLEDGEPFEQTVYVEVLDEGRWKDHAYYDGASS